MIALLLALAAAPQEEPAVHARFTCTPERVEVGEPFELALELDHPVGASAFSLGGAELELDDSWIVLDRQREAPRLAPDDDRRRITRRTWTVASLEPGTRMLADALSVLVSDPAIASVDASRTAVEVAGLLAEGEDAPRPLRGFPEGFGQATEPRPSPWRWAALGAAALFARRGGAGARAAGGARPAAGDLDQGPRAHAAPPLRADAPRALRRGRGRGPGRPDGRRVDGPAGSDRRPGPGARA
jgi:hypothetical protein